MNKIIKVALPKYLVVLSFVYAISLPFISGVSKVEEIGIVLDSRFALLAIIVFSNTYHIEVSMRTSQIYYLMTSEYISMDLLKRVVTKFFFIMLLFLFSYFGYMIRRPYLLIGQTHLDLFINSILVISVNILLWGMLAYFFVGVTSNLWIGISIILTIWFFFISTIAKKLPVYMNVFAYGHMKDLGMSKYDLYIGKTLSLMLAILLFLINRKLSERSPCR
ncbi:hypothetical protein PV797_05100 [Clostridiaceae bacterium M8S5]|nr:hypothetical protein PV797_05100 [Clostridiaceae bacterium M8S5]